MDDRQHRGECCCHLRTSIHHRHGELLCTAEGASYLIILAFFTRTISNDDYEKIRRA